MSAVRSGLLRAAAVVALTVATVLGAAVPASAGVPDQQMEASSDVITHDGCGRLWIWFDDDVAFSRDKAWQETDVVVTGYSAVQFDWTCADVPRPELPEVTITENMTIPGLDPSLNAGISVAGRKDVTISVDPEFGQKVQGESSQQYTPALTWTADGSQARWENGYTLPGRGRNASVEHRLSADIVFPDGSNGYRNTLRLACSDDARD